MAAEHLGFNVKFVSSRIKKRAALKWCRLYMDKEENHCRIYRIKGGDKVSWNKEDLSQYNHADSPWFIVSTNGKVDIGNKQGDGDTKNKITPPWMYKLVHEWLKSNQDLSSEQKNNLIKQLK
ncbi:hypothetical protein [Peribacillus frigoritolerans]|uniref:hypothetical protein n=1 Tax=Peribacillus frigoritolerans TaxID=450367 RepID=UPI0039A10514